MTLTLHLLGVEVFSLTLGAPAEAEAEDVWAPGSAASDVQIAPVFGYTGYDETEGRR